MKNGSRVNEHASAFLNKSTRKGLHIRSGTIYLFIMEVSRSQVTCDKEGGQRKVFGAQKTWVFFRLCCEYHNYGQLTQLNNLWLYLKNEGNKNTQDLEHWWDETLHSKSYL